MEKKNNSTRISVIGRTIRITGSLEANEDLHYLGHFDGEINLNDHHLIIGEGAQVDAQIQGREITVEGNVSGTINPGESLQIRASGSISGDTYTPRLQAEDGALLSGHFTVGAWRGAGKKIPNFDTLRRLVQSELQGLNEQQLDFTSKSPDWAHWSIRRQVSHMANCVYFWLFGRWGELLWENASPDPELIEIALSRHDHDRMLDPSRYRSISSLLRMLNRSYDLINEVAGRETVNSISKKKLTLRIDLDSKVGTSEENQHQLWKLFAPFHSRGITQDQLDPHVWTFTLEATLKHLYFEQLSHLRTIQRLKKKQGLRNTTRISRKGYLQLDNFWDD